VGVHVSDDAAGKDPQDLSLLSLAVAPGDRPKSGGPPSIGEPLLQVQLSTSVVDRGKHHLGSIVP
jgi:hypothetical protein